jgi:hypothetical protein
VSPGQLANTGIFGPNGGFPRHGPRFPPGLLGLVTFRLLQCLVSFLENNYLLNPRNPDFAGIRIEELRPFVFDSRLFK